MYKVCLYIYQEKTTKCKQIYTIPIEYLGSWENDVLQPTAAGEAGSAQD